MLKKLQDVELVEEYFHRKAHLYRLETPNLENHYYIISSASTRRLLNAPEVTGFECYDCMCNPTKVTLDYFNNRKLIDSANILTILRGGLNYPLEECCYRTGIPVNDMSFLSCERVFEGELITGLDIRYKKLTVVPRSTLIIGDIIATGDTLVKCLKYVVKEYRQRGASLRNIIFFTIGGNMAITVLENLTEELREYWPDFEGCYVVYHEGMFSTYKEKGVCGINLPFVDFYWRDSILAPEYRRQTLDDDDALFEKCTIYDGGARRYEIPAHYHEVLEYWEGLAPLAGTVDFPAFVQEKLGYEDGAPQDFEEWLTQNHYRRIDRQLARELYEQEQQFLESVKDRRLSDICQRRIREFKAAVGPHIHNI